MDPVLLNLLMTLAGSANTKSSNKSDLEALLSEALGIFSGTYQQQQNPKSDPEFLRQVNMPVANEILMANNPNSIRYQILAMVERGESDAAIKNWIDGIGGVMDTDAWYAANPTEPYETKENLKSLVDKLKGEQRDFQKAVLTTSVSDDAKSVYAKAGLPEPDAPYPGPDPDAAAAITQTIGDVALGASQKRLKEIEAERAKKNLEMGIIPRTPQQKAELAGYTDPDSPGAGNALRRLAQDISRQYGLGGASWMMDPKAQPTGKREQEARKAYLAKLQELGINTKTQSLGDMPEGMEGAVGDKRAVRRQQAVTPSGYMAGVSPSLRSEELKASPLDANDKDYLKLKAFEKNKDAYFQEAQRLFSERIRQKQAAQGTGSPLMDALVRRTYLNRLMNNG